MLRHDTWLGMLLAFYAACAASAAGAAYPEHPIRLIVAYPAGASTNDILGRALAERLSRALQQNVVIDNRPGAGGTVGTALVAHAEPADIVRLLDETITQIVGTPEMHNLLVKQGVEIMSLGPQPFAKFIADELDRWGDVIRKSGIRIQ